MRVSSGAPASEGSDFERGDFGPRMIFVSDSVAVSPEKGLVPVRACQVTTASEKTSARSSTSLPSICSGGM